ncbi:2-nitropropane dioxygenase, NPD [Mycobacterium haemophilum DSM 44634]|uniref:NAD(P)H-dependent flavin oxidoreductase n=1 Tax=Mycobacterium haemophilum TaxID=29311 RepID=UPI000655C168|nr:nitronate monooxygenase family protein [Mycobacterium haemophilum]AKN17276.1 monooxygenase [Mycobacterium haemophilum DSM 44634]MCV7339554.1 nitronate monooxygenase [Mycobacterium haemophilum DSM 44634]
MRTRVAELLGVEFPICAFSHCRDVVAAVSNAGGFGILGAVAHSPQRLQNELTWIEEQTGGKPYGVDLLLPPKYVGAEQGGIDAQRVQALLPAEHRAFVDDLLFRYDIAPTPDTGAVSRGSSGGLNISPMGYQPLLDVAFAHRIRLIASALGPPPSDVVERAHNHNVLVAALAGTTQHARRHAAAGVDLIVAQGTEAGGHTGEVATMVLVPEIVDAVDPLPVLAAGGIARGRQIAAALALGAEGVWCGSVWLTTEEAETPPVIKDKFLAATSSDTVRSRSLTGKPARMLRTAWTDEWDRPDSPDPLGMPLQSALIGDPQVRINQAAGHPGAKARELATYFVGQVVGSLDRVRPARAVVLDMVAEFIDTIGQLESLVDR